MFAILKLILLIIFKNSEKADRGFFTMMLAASLYLVQWTKWKKNSVIKLQCVHDTQSTLGC